MNLSHAIPLSNLKNHQLIKKLREYCDDYPNNIEAIFLSDAISARTNFLKYLLEKFCNYDMDKMICQSERDIMAYFLKPDDYLNSLILFRYASLIFTFLSSIGLPEFFYITDIANPDTAKWYTFVRVILGYLEYNKQNKDIFAKCQDQFVQISSEIKPRRDYYDTLKLNIKNAKLNIENSLKEKIDEKYGQLKDSNNYLKIDIDFLTTQINTDKEEIINCDEEELLNKKYSEYVIKCDKLSEDISSNPDIIIEEVHHLEKEIAELKEKREHSLLFIHQLTDVQNKLSNFENITNLHINKLITNFENTSQEKCSILKLINSRKSESGTLTKSFSNINAQLNILKAEEKKLLSQIRDLEEDVEPKIKNMTLLDISNERANIKMQNEKEERCKENYITTLSKLSTQIIDLKGEMITLNANSAKEYAKLQEMVKEFEKTLQIEPLHFSTN